MGYRYIQINLDVLQIASDYLQAIAVKTEYEEESDLYLIFPDKDRACIYPNSYAQLNIMLMYNDTSIPYDVLEAKGE